jgi:phage protein U
LAWVGEAGYPEAIIPMKGGSIPVKLSGGAAGGYDDPETKTLLKELIALTKQKQNVNLTVEDGRSFPAYVMAKADENRVEANERKGTSRRRLRR